MTRTAVIAGVGPGLAGVGPGLAGVGPGLAGVGPGLGASLARRFATEGCQVGLFARSE